MKRTTINILAAVAGGLMCLDALTGLISIPAFGADVLPVTNNLACWYDASAGVTQDGSGVSVWADRSGNGHSATRASGAPQLALNQINSLPALQLRGNSTWFNCAGEMFTKEQYVVVRSPNTNWNGSGSFLGRVGTFLAVRGSSYNFYSGYTGFWNDQLPSAVSKDGTVVSSGSGTMPRGGFELVTITNFMILKITVNDAADEANRAAYPYYHIGKCETLGTMDSDIAEIIGYSNTLSASEEKLVGGYLADKYRIVAAYPPVAPTGLAGTPGIMQISLNWAAVFGATGYNVSRSATSGSGYLLIGTASTNAYTDNSARIGINYYYVVSATNNWGESMKSTQVELVMPPPGTVMKIH